jgi:argininosuccinate lyase
MDAGLVKIIRELAEGTFDILGSDEDIHSAVERRLTELVPKDGGRLHTGRSRNDQVALDLRLYCRGAISNLVRGIAELTKALAEQATTHANWPMPGYTHLQRAQTVTVGHHLLAHAEPLLRDARRLQFAYEMADEMPLGSGALAGSTLKLAREVVAEELGFSRLTQNSLDAVSDRDFLLDLAYACLSVAIHLSRLGEDVVLWASAEFGFVQLADEISTGSSLMPQKKNPDIAELLRGRSGRALGSLTSMAMILKGLPLAYDRDLQETKEPLLSTVRNTGESLSAAAILVSRLVFDRDRLREAVADPGLYATDTAERMVAEGRPFRQAHEEVGRQVREGTHMPVLDPDASLSERDLVGAPKPERVRSRGQAVLTQASVLAGWADLNPPRTDNAARG